MNVKIKKTALALVLLLLASSCAKGPAVESPAKETKTERPLWWVLRYKETGSERLAYEDKWYRYSAKFNYIKPGEAFFTNAVYSQCPIGSARYTVTDKESGLVVRLEDFDQIPCESCHRR